MTLFADTSYLYAGLVANDARHAEAIALLDRAEGRDVVTTNHIAGECWSLLRRRWGHSVAVRFLNQLEQSSVIEVRHIPESLEGDAFDWLRQHDEREYSFVDATSFAFMRSNQITEALAFDGDFTAAGFVELRA